MSKRSQTHDEIPTEAERALQAYWDTIGLDHSIRVRILADLDQKAAPGRSLSDSRDIQQRHVAMAKLYMVV